jgi:iron complex outermembrane receptor protein
VGSFFFTIKYIRIICIVAIFISNTNTIIIAQDISLDSTKINFNNDTLENKILSDVYVTAIRNKDHVLPLLSTIHNTDLIKFKENSSSIFEAMNHMQGVQMISPSLGFKVINTRGFANTTNVRFTQLVDGLDVQSPHIGGPIGNALGPSDLDLQYLSIVPGSAASLYGTNSTTGLAYLTTKSPFVFQGISFEQKTGLNHINNGGVKPKLFSESSIRYVSIDYALTPHLLQGDPSDQKMNKDKN